MSACLGSLAYLDQAYLGLLDGVPEQHQLGERKPLKRKAQSLAKRCGISSLCSIPNDPGISSAAGFGFVDRFLSYWVKSISQQFDSMLGTSACRCLSVTANLSEVLRCEVDLSRVGIPSVCE